MKIRLALIALLGAAALDAQPVVTVTDVGPGGSGPILRNALSLPHRLVEPDTGWFFLVRGEAVPTTLIVLGRTAAISGRVQGDVIVVGGDLHVRPGGDIEGRAIAIGGGVYPSLLSRISRGTESFRDNTFEISRVDNDYQLQYRSLRVGGERALTLPGVYGIRVPSYDRVNGLSVGFGPAFTFPGERGDAHAVVTYRSDIGKFDPAIWSNLQLSRRLRVQARAERGTFTNESWIWTDPVNSLSSLGAGVDTRNYYRADRGDLSLHRLWETAHWRIEPFLGGRYERAWSVGPLIGENSGPWSALNRKDTIDGMWRPNPQITPGTMTSGIAGAALIWAVEDLSVRARSRAEVPFSAPGDSKFTQVVSDLDVGFITFGEQDYSLEVRWVTTPGDTPPLQRFHYIGGSGTLSFTDVLEQGGDELLFIDQRYRIPVLSIQLPFLGSPTFQLRHRLGSAGVGDLPTFEQSVGVGVILTLLRAEFQVNPANGDTKIGIGLSFSR